MIDIENEVFNYIATRLRSAVQGIFVSGEYVQTPPKFPCVTIEQNDNSVVANFRTNKIENLVSVMFEINVYSNKDSGKKAQAKEIMSLVDGYMSGLGFTRTMLSPLPNLEDSTIYRLTARYSADVDMTTEGTNINCMIYQN